MRLAAEVISGQVGCDRRDHPVLAHGAGENGVHLKNS